MKASLFFSRTCLKIIEINLIKVLKTHQKLNNMN
jgi:hypothetical protein